MITSATTTNANQCSHHPPTNICDWFLAPVFGRVQGTCCHLRAGKMGHLWGSGACGCPKSWVSQFVSWFKALGPYSVVLKHSGRWGPSAQICRSSNSCSSKFPALGDSSVINLWKRQGIALGLTHAHPNSCHKYIIFLHVHLGMCNNHPYYNPSTIQL